MCLDGTFLPRFTGDLLWSSALTWSKIFTGLRDFEFNDNAVRNQKVFRPIAANVRGQDQSSIEFSCEPILCRKKAKTG